MKKLIAFAIVVTVASISTADFAVELKNDGGTFSTTDVATDYVDSALIQLVWNTSAPGDAVDASLTNVGTVLNSVTTTSGYAGTFSDQVQGIITYTQSNTGYLTVRVFDNANKGVGDDYFEFNVDVDGTLTTYDSQLASTVYDTESAIAGGSFASAANMTIIPEPATIGLLGIAGAGLFAARRKTRA